MRIMCHERFGGKLEPYCLRMQFVAFVYIWFVLGHGYMSGGGSYITSTVYMCDGAQVYQEEPSDPIAGKTEAKTQEHRREPSPLIASKVEAQAQL